MKSNLSRLEKLEARSPSPLVLGITIDGVEREMSVDQYAAIPDDQRPSGSDFRVIRGSDLRQIDKLLKAVVPGLPDNF